MISKVYGTEDQILSTTGLFNKPKYDTDTKNLRKKIKCIKKIDIKKKTTEIENKKFDTTGLVINGMLMMKVTEIENEISDTNDLDTKTILIQDLQRLKVRYKMLITL